MSNIRVTKGIAPRVRVRVRLRVRLRVRVRVSLRLRLLRGRRAVHPPRISPLGTRLRRRRRRLRLGLGRLGGRGFPRGPHGLGALGRLVRVRVRVRVRVGARVRGRVRARAS